MQKILAATVAGLMFAGPAAAEKLTVATFNAEFLIRQTIHAREGSLDLSPSEAALWTPQRRETAFDAAVAKVAPVISGLNADIIVLTEVGPLADVNDLNAALSSPYPHVTVCACTDTQTRQHVAILSKVPLTNVATSLDGREYYLNEPDDEDSEADTGISKGVRADFAFNGQPFTIYGIHLRSEGGGADADSQRVAQASIVRRHYLRDLGRDRHVIVAGDLNDKRGDPTLVRIRGLDDIEPDLIQTGHAKYFDKADVDQRWTYEFEGQLNQIDHILLSDSIRAASTRIHSRVQRVIDPTISDHSPLVVEITFP